MKEITLNGQWELHCGQSTEPLEAFVPGSVFHDLMEHGLMEDPFYRDNEKLARELSRYDYTYVREFTVSKEYLKLERMELRCEGIDTLAELFINDKSVGIVNNMHRLYEFDIKNVLEEGVNTIRIEFASVTEYARKKFEDKELFQFSYALPGMGHIRKAHYMLGWDWGPQIPDMGIYRPIMIRAYEAGKITDVRIHQDHDNGMADVSVTLELELQDQEVTRQVLLRAPDGTTMEYGGTENHCVFHIDNPELWWPSGYGKQNLYQVEVNLLKREAIVDQKRYQIGLRTMELIQEEDQWGVSCSFRVNGVGIYLKGADYIPEDNILPRCSRERSKRLLSDCIESNHNAVRVWGGGLYPEEYFFDLCDELGIIVWQDLMFACATYDSEDAEFMETTLAELRYNMGRIRHRACLGLICGNNEMELAHVDWDMKNREEEKQKYLDMFERLLPELAGEAAPDVPYWLASPTSGGKFLDPNSEDRGDMHYWGVWHQCKPFTEYRTIFPRFMSEFGIQSFPCLKTLETCTLPKDRNIFSRVMELHQKGGPEGNERILNYVSQLYRYPKNFESLLYISQMIQAEGLRYGVEHFRRIYGRCMGAIYWQLNDCWPVASWSSIDSCGRWKALQYFSKKFFAPILVSANDGNKQMEVYITNDCNRAAALDLCWTLYRFDGTKVKAGTFPVDMEPGCAKKVLELDFTSEILTEEDERNHCVMLELKENQTVISDNLVYFTQVKYMDLKDPDIQVRVEDRQDCFALEFTADVFVKSLFVDFKDNDFVLSDNYFDLIPGRVKTVSLSKLRAPGMSREALEEQLKLISIVDTYE